MHYEYSIETLEENFKKLSSSILTNRKYFHLQTVKNFIQYFPAIKNNNDRLWVLNNLNDYLENCTSHINSIDRYTSSILYMKYLDKIGDFYRK